MLYYFLGASAVLLVASLGFYVIGSIADIGDLPSSQTGVTTDGSTSLSGASEETGEVITDEDGNQLVANVTTVSKPLPIIGEVYSDRKRIADSFSKL